MSEQIDGDEQPQISQKRVRKQFSSTDKKIGFVLVTTILVALAYMLGIWLTTDSGVNNTETVSITETATEEIGVTLTTTEKGWQSQTVTTTISITVDRGGGMVTEVVTVIGDVNVMQSVVRTITNTETKTNAETVIYTETVTKYLDTTNTETIIQREPLIQTETETIVQTETETIVQTETVTETIVDEDLVDKIS